MNDEDKVEFRPMIATVALHALISRSSLGALNPDLLAKDAVEFTDALLKELGEPK